MRLVELGVEPWLAGSALKLAVAQRLVRKLCTNCRQEVPSASIRAELGISKDGPASIYRAGGCSRCNDTGYLGRTAIYEVLPMTSAIRKLIGRSTEEIHDEAVANGMITLREDGYRLVFVGETSLEEIGRVVGSDRD